MNKNTATQHKSLDVTFQNFQQTENPGIIKAQCRVAYAGENRNYTRISREAFEKAIPSIHNIPVVGNWLGDNFGGHDVILESNGNEVTIKDNTIAYGVVPKDTAYRWETHTNKFGEQIEYFVVDVLLWYERYPEEISFIADNNGVGQSMEIMVTDGEFADDDYFNINDFYYSALCLLGRDTENPDKHVEPCFEDAGVYFNLGDSVKAQVNEFSKFIERSGEIMEKNLEENVAQEEEETKEVLEHNDDTNKEEVNEEVSDTEGVEDVEHEDELEEVESSDEEESTAEDDEDANSEAESDEEVSCGESDEAEEDVVLQEMQEQIDALKKENADLRAKLDKFEAEKEEEAINEVVDKYSTLLDSEVIHTMLEKGLDAKELKYELAVVYAETALSENQASKKNNRVVTASNFAIELSDNDDENKDKFAIK